VAARRSSCRSAGRTEGCTDAGRAANSSLACPRAARAGLGQCVGLRPWVEGGEAPWNQRTGWDNSRPERNRPRVWSRGAKTALGPDLRFATSRFPPPRSPHHVKSVWKGGKLTKEQPGKDRARWRLCEQNHTIVSYIYFFLVLFPCTVLLYILCFIVYYCTNKAINQGMQALLNTTHPLAGPGMQA
jgi:hypothetical protein